jgi:predicted GIY-YIG superfamily endonuclease
MSKAPVTGTAPWREKEIKNRRREKKDTLARTVNPEWKDLAEEGNDFSPRSK